METTKVKLSRDEVFQSKNKGEYNLYGRKPEKDWRTSAKYLTNNQGESMNTIAKKRKMTRISSVDAKWYPTLQDLTILSR
jgi:hypothetical protein